MDPGIVDNQVKFHTERAVKSPEPTPALPLSSEVTASALSFISRPDISYFWHKRAALAVSFQALVTHKKVTKFRVITSTNFGKVQNITSPIS